MRRWSSRTRRSGPVPLVQDKACVLGRLEAGPPNRSAEAAEPQDQPQPVIDRSQEADVELSHRRL